MMCRMNLIFLSLLLGLANASLREPTEDFDHFAELSEDRFMLYWKFDGKNITFEMRARALGYVAIGLMKEESFEGTDYAIGWVKYGSPILYDMEGQKDNHPLVDDQQDLLLLDGGEDSDIGTFIKFTRSLDTCDFDQDVPVTNGTIRIVWGLHDQDPDNPWKVMAADMYGIAELQLLVGGKSDMPLPANAFPIEFTVDDFAVPTNETLYWCKRIKVPELGSRHQMVMYEPIITPGNDNLVHHMLLLGCNDYEKGYLVGKSAQCYEREGFELHFGCPVIIAAWTIGGGKQFLPEQAGLSLGAAGNFESVILQIFYNNPHHKPGMKDSSGIKFFMTSELRPEEASIIQAGMYVNHFHVIPPRFEHLVSRSFCFQSCLEKALDDGPIHVYSVYFYTHMATQVRIRHFRRGRELPLLAEDPHHNPENQMSTMLPHAVEVQAGDELVTECVYDTTARSWFTVGGLSMHEEMCIAFLGYYPRKPLSFCTSSFSLEQLFRAMKFDPAKDKWEDRLWMEFWRDSPWEDLYMRVYMQESYLTGMAGAVCTGGPSNADLHPQKPRVGDGIPGYQEYMTHMPKYEHERPCEDEDDDDDDDDKEPWFPRADSACDETASLLVTLAIVGMTDLLQSI